MELRSDFGERTINELCLMFRNRQINLEPGFQRQSMWTNLDRRRLIQSIASAYPIPCIFLYKRSLRGRLVYDVIDGKQRLETILMFTRQGRFRRDWFDVRLPVDDGLDESVNAHTLARISREWIATLNTMKRMFPDLRQTRFRNTADFYSLFLIVWEMRDKGMVRGRGCARTFSGGRRCPAGVAARSRG
jgi:hypothetical protein